MESMILFGLLQLVNVVLGTLRSICTIKANKHVGMALNTISFTFYAILVKFTNGQELWYLIVITAVTNCFGFYLASWIFQKMQKDKLWRITLNVGLNKNIDSGEIKQCLDKYGISYTFALYEGGYTFDIYSYNQHQSMLVKDIIPKGVRYSVIEIEKSL